MITILDTNILISALLDTKSLPANLVQAWRRDRYNLITSEPQLREFRRVSRYPKIAKRISPPLAGKFVKRLRDVAIWVDHLPEVDHCRDPADNYLLAMAQVSKADFLVTGDKADLLVIGRHEATKILTVAQFAQILGI